MAIDLCTICDILQSTGSSRRLIVTRSTRARVSSVKAVQLILCTVIISDDLIGHSELGNDASRHHECGRNFPDHFLNDGSHFEDMGQVWDYACMQKDRGWVWAEGHSYVCVPPFTQCIPPTIYVCTL